MHTVDLKTSGYKVTHDPTDHISTDPSSVLKEPVDTLGDILSNLPKLALEAIMKLITAPFQWIDELVDKFPELEEGFWNTIDWAAGLLPWNWFRTGRRGGTNLVLDGSFESDVWDDFDHGDGVELSEDVKRSGTRSYKLTGPASAIQLSHDGEEDSLLHVQPDEKYFVESWAYFPTTNTNNGNVVLWAMARSSTGAMPPVDTVIPNSGSHKATVANSTANEGKWNRVSTYYKVPAYYDRVRFALSTSTSFPADDVVYVDDLLVREATENQNLVEILFGGIGDLTDRILESLIPGLDASKITGGTFPQTMITGLGNFINYIKGGRISGTNLVSDPIITDVNLWSGDNVDASVVTEQRRSVTQSLKMQGGAKSVFAVRDDSGPVFIVAEPGEKFFGQAYARPHTSNARTGSVALRVRIRDSSGANPEHIANVSSVATTALSNGWNKLSGYIVMPDGYDRINMELHHAPSVTAGEVYYWDDLIFREVTESQNIVARIFGSIGNAVGSIVEAIIPGLHASKIIGGTFAQSMVTGLSNVVNNLLGRNIAGPNLVTSPNFEDPTQWPDDAVSADSTEKRLSGTRSRKIVSTATQQNFVFTNDYRGQWWNQQIAQHYWTVQAGDKFQVEVSVFAPSTNTFGTGTAPALRAIYGDSTGTLALGGMNVHAPTWANYQTSANGWGKLSGYFTVPEGYDLLTFIYRVEANDPAGNVYYLDNLVVREVTQGQNIVQRIFGSIGNTIGNILEAVIPGLNASKITGGTFAQSMVSGLAQLGKFVFGGRTTGTNLVTDPSFEDDAEWPGSVGVMSTEQKHSAASSRKVTTTAGQLGLFFNTNHQHSNASSEGALWKTQAGEKFSMEGWFFKPSTNIVTGTPPRLRIAWHDSTGTNPITYTTVDGGAAWTPFVNNTWIKLSGYATVPAGYDRLRPFVEWLTNEPAGNVWYVDDLSVREVTESQNIVARIFGSIGNTIGNILEALIPGLNASKITSGSFPQSMVTGLSTALSALVPKTFFNLFNRTTNLATDPLVKQPDLWSETHLAVNGGWVEVTKTSAYRRLYLVRDVVNGSTGPYLPTQTGRVYDISCEAKLVSGPAVANNVTVFGRGQNEAGALASMSGSTNFSVTTTPTTLSMRAVATNPATVEFNPCIEVRDVNADPTVIAFRNFKVVDVTESQALTQSLFGGGNIVNTIIESVIPGIHASKITAGTFAQSMITGLGNFVNFIRGGQISGSNLVTDRTISNTTLWSGGGFQGTISTEQRRSGTRSIKLTGTGNWNSYFYVTRDENSYYAVDVEPGEKYYFETWVYPHASNGTTGVIYLAATLSDSTGVNSNTSPNFASANAAVLTKGQWQKVSGYITIPAGYDQMAPYITLSNTVPTNNHYYVDDPTVREVTESQNIVARIFGGIGNTIGNILEAIIPGLHASKITGGSFAQSMVTGLATSLANLVPKTLFGIKIRDGNNLAFGGDMERDVIPNGYTWYPGTYSVEQRRYGSRSRKITKTSASQVQFALIYDPADSTETDPALLAVTPGEKYIVEMWVRPHASNTGTQNIGIWGLCRDSGSATPDSFPEGLTVTSVPAGWSKLAYTFTIPDGYNLWFPYFVINATTATNNVYYVDSVTVREVTQTQSLMDRLTGFVNSTPWQLDNWILNLLTGNSALKAQNLVGTPSPKLFGLIPISSIGEQEINLLENPTFEAAESLSAVAGWTWDGSQRHSKTGGSAKATANGTRLDLRGNLIPVAPNQQLYCEIHTRWQGLVSTGQPIALVVEALSQGEVVETKTLEKVYSPGANRTNWVQLDGTYTVPRGNTVTGGVVDQVRLDLQVGATATAGQVWFSDGLVRKKLVRGIAPLDWVSGLPDILDGIGEFAQNIIQTIMRVITGIPFVGWLFDDLFDEINSWFDDTQDTAATAADAWMDTRDTISHIVRSVFGDDNPYNIWDPASAREALDNVYRTLTDNTRTLQEMRARDSGEQATGQVIDVDFSDYPDGPLPNIFSVSYTGPGTSQLIVKKGKAMWDKLNNQNRDAWVIYNDPTATNFQLLRGTMASPPEDTTDGGRPHFYALGRVSSPAAQVADGGISCVWVRAWSVGSLFLYRGDIGCYKNGVEYVWASNIPLTWSLDMTFMCGVGNDPRQYQVFSGSKQVFTYTETAGQPGGLSVLADDTFDGDGQRIVDDRYRRWGSLAQLRRDNNGDPNGGGAVAGCSIADNELPAVTGTTAMMYRTSTGNMSLAGGSNITMLPTNYFEFVGRASRDISVNIGQGAFKVNTAGNYAINVRLKMASTYSATIMPLLMINGVAAAWGDYIGHPDNAKAAIAGHWFEHLEPNDVVRIATWSNGFTVNGLTGEASGAETKFDITKVG